MILLRLRSSSESSMANHRAAYPPGPIFQSGRRHPAIPIASASAPARTRSVNHRRNWHGCCSSTPVLVVVRTVQGIEPLHAQRAVISQEGNMARRPAAPVING